MHIMQPEPDRWRPRQPAAAPPSRAATRQRVSGVTCGDETAALPSGSAPSSGQPSERLHAQLGAALAKLRACTEGGAPLVSGSANRIYQDALKAAHDALTQARSAPGWRTEVAQSSFLDFSHHSCAMFTCFADTV